MKGVVLAGGKGTRLSPLTDTVNKHLLPVGRYPMICYPLDRLKKAGVTRILIVTGRMAMGQMAALLGSGIDYGLSLTYRVQEGAGGIAAALVEAEEFAGGDRVVVILGDNLFQADLRPYIDAFNRQPQGAMILLKEVDDPRGYGIALVADSRLVELAEKPRAPKSNLCVTGIYLYDARVFGLIRSLTPSARGELEITDVNRAYLDLGQLTYDLLPGWWIDAGTFHSLETATEIVRDEELFRARSHAMLPDPPV